MRGGELKGLVVSAGSSAALRLPSRELCEACNHRRRPARAVLNVSPGCKADHLGQQHSFRS